MLFILNIGSVIWYIYFTLFLALVILLLKKVKWLWHKIGKSLYWNGLIRLFLETY